MTRLPPGPALAEADEAVLSDAALDEILRAVLRLAGRCRCRAASAWSRRA
ncbi:MAG TPA: hypothetical protein VMI33_25890 [Streptosporangiaceae bacterium]|nr:hypothetical protein [Streptosporangiaceae bacterium]